MSNEFSDYQFEEGKIWLECKDEGYRGDLYLHGVPDINGEIKEKGSFIGRLLKHDGKIVQYSKHVFHYNIMYKFKGTPTIGINYFVLGLLPDNSTVALRVEEVVGLLTFYNLTARECREFQTPYKKNDYELQGLVELSYFRPYFISFKEE